MKILIFFIIATTVLAVRHPPPLCRTSPLPSLIPVSIGQQLRFDLEQVFYGYNLSFTAPQAEHIDLAPKYIVKQNKNLQSYNLSAIKIKEHNRFLGLDKNGNFSGVVVGTYDEQKGISVQFYVNLQVEDTPNLRCYDLDQLSVGNHSLVVVDCAFFHMGQLVYNQFLYINITSKLLIQGRHLSDTFVNFNFLSKRKIQVVTDPFTRVTYLYRFLLRQGVGVQHQDNTYFEVFMMNDPLTPELIDVIDHTYFDMPTLSIVDYQVFANLIYILAYNKGLYELRFTPDQFMQIRSKVQLGSDLTRFKVDRMGFNDDLIVVATNGQVIYQFQWDVTTPARLIGKYTLMPNSEVNQLFVDYRFIIISVAAVIDEQLVKRTWIFSRATKSYVHAYNSFHDPLNGYHIIHWNQHGTDIQIFDSFFSYSVKMSLPILKITPDSPLLANKNQSITISALSISEGQKASCDLTLNFVYLFNNDTRIINTGLFPSQNIYVDSPDTRQIRLAYQFFGRNLTYQTTFDTNSSKKPFSYVDKQHEAVIQWPPEIDTSKICFFQMFLEGNENNEYIYGLLQIADVSVQKTKYTSFYVQCKVGIFNRDETYHFSCRIVTTVYFSMGKIIHSSQIFEANQRRIALIFDNQPNTIYIYYFEQTTFFIYGRKDYANDASNKINSVAIAQRKLFVVFQVGKRVQVFNLEDLQQPVLVSVQPKLVLNSMIMRFFGVPYFAPVSIKISRLHKQVIFIKTKVGVVVMNINQDYMPELLFTVATNNIRYDFEVNHQNLLILTQEGASLYDFDTPLRRNNPPYKRSQVAVKFKINQYDQVCSDRLFYMVGQQSVFVINPRYHSTSALYSQIWLKDSILSVDAVNIQGKQVLFLQTKASLVVYVFAEDPMLFIQWPAGSQDFKLSLTAKNSKVASQPYSLGFSVLNFNQTVIKPTQNFNQTQIRKLGSKKAPDMNKTFSLQIPLNDSSWFQGNVLRYHLQCEQCNGTVKVINHVEQTRQMVEARAVYDIQSTLDGIYAQQYSSLLKTYTYNDSIHFINQIPTQMNGESCSKVAVGDLGIYVMSLCQAREQVNVYITSSVATKPFTFGPYRTEAKQVNFAKIVGQILMIVDNSDNPFVRSGGIYLYHLNFDIQQQDFITFLDFIDQQDLQFQGYTGRTSIASADLVLPYYDSSRQYRLFVTEARTGGLFVFGFEISADGEEVIYISKKHVSLPSLIPTQVKAPTPLRIHNVAVHYAYQNNDKSIDFYLLITVSNWHHMQVLISLAQNDDLLAFKLERLFERFPWQLHNYFKFKKSRSYNTYFAVPYRDPDVNRQIVLIYNVPYLIRNQGTYEQKYAPHQYQLLAGAVPLLRPFGAHLVRDRAEVAYAFHTFGNAGKQILLFTDVDGYNITQLTLHPNISVSVVDLPVQKTTINLTAFNPYTNFTFMIDLDFYKQHEDEELRQEILWIVIVCIGGLMIFGLFIAFCKQKQSEKNAVQDEHKQTLITIDDQFKNNIDINRSSADPLSQRDSMTPSAQS